MLLWKCFQHGTRHVFLSFYPCQGTWVGFLLEPHHSIEINLAPQQAVCQKAGTAVRKQELSFGHSGSSTGPKGSCHIQLSICSWAQKQQTEADRENIIQIVDPAAGRQSCLCSALIFQSQSLRGEAVWVSSFLAFPIAGHIWKEPWENTKCRRKGNT